jgi:alkyl hydroperoxide reductase subunit AhpC
MSLLVGKQAPIFKGTAVKGGPADTLNPDNFTEEISLENYKGKWVVFFFYPLDFTFVCPTEIADMGKHYEEFKKLNCEIVGCSTDSYHSHFAWRRTERDLMNLPFPLLADFTGANAKAYEVYKEETGYALRGTYIINPEGELVYSLIHPEAVGRNSNEILRVLQALQTGALTACGWNPGDKTLS